MTHSTRMIPWVFWWLGPPLKIFVSVRSAFGIICTRLLNFSDHVFPSCFLGARIDLSVEDEVVALALAKCPARPYTELIKSGIPGPSSLKPARPAALRPSPPSSMRVSPVGPSAATPTRGKLLAQLETLSRKPRSVKRKTPSFAEKGRPTLAKVPKLGASSSSPSSPIRKPEQASSPAAEAPIVLNSQPPSKSAASTTRKSQFCNGFFSLQIRCKPIKIRRKSLLATDLQQNNFVAKNLVAIFHTLAFGCK